jgi:hypothetical protein
MALGQYIVGIIYKVEWTAQEQQTRGFTICASRISSIRKAIRVLIKKETQNLTDVSFKLVILLYCEVQLTFLLMTHKSAELVKGF